MLKILALALAIVALVFAADRNQWFGKVGILGDCRVVTGPNGDGSQWWSCDEGFLNGYPSLKRDGCELRGTRGSRQIWRCPAPIERGPGGFL